MLKVENLKVNFGGIEAVKGISFEVHEGEIVTLIGSNGAGKSTTLRAISGLVKPSEGKIIFEGNDITKIGSSEIVGRGITLCPEGRRIFPDMTVIENIQLAGTLSGGEQQMLAVARSLMSRPKIMMLDEPSLGLAPLVVKDIFNILKEINEEGVTILLIEQNANMALRLADKAYVLETGTIAMQGTGKELLDNPKIKEAYLGKKN